MKMFVVGICCCGCKGLMKLKTEVGVRRLAADLTPEDSFYCLGVLFSDIFARTFLGPVALLDADFN